MDENWDAASAVLRLGGPGGRDGSSRAGWEVSADGCCSSPASPRSWRPCWATRWCRWPVVRPTFWRFPTNGKCLPGAGGIMVRDACFTKQGLCLPLPVPTPLLALLAHSPSQMCQARWVWVSCSCFTAYQGPSALGFTAFAGDRSQAGLLQQPCRCRRSWGVLRLCVAVSCALLSSSCRSARAGYPGVPQLPPAGHSPARPRGSEGHLRHRFLHGPHREEPDSCLWEQQVRGGVRDYAPELACGLRGLSSPGRGSRRL